jgi:hypothetical protein
MFARPRPWVAVGLGLGLSLAGCATRGNLEVLESQLRKQEAVIQKYQRETGQLRSELALTQKELDLLRSDLTSKTQLAVAEESSRGLARVTGIVFNSLLTAGQNRDENPGDEGFHAVFYPHDEHGEIVKVTGSIELEAIDLSRPGPQKTIGHWEFAADEAREHWLAGFLTSGYQFEQNWQETPVGAKVLLLARLVTLDGRKFETTLAIPIEVPSRSPGATPLTSSGRPSEILQASYEEPAQERRVPEPDLNQELPPRSTEQATSLVPAAPAVSSLAPPAALGHSLPGDGTDLKTPPAKGAPRPFPPVILRTSDSWTNGSIPAWR